MIIVDVLIAYGQAPAPGAERYFGNGKESCHMSCDGDLEELHRFAERIGLRRTWFQNERGLPHYDLTPSKRRAALLNGAVKEVADLKKRVSQEVAARDQLNAYVNEVERDLGRTKRMLTTTRTAKTKLENRIKNGVCPCCHRSFVQLQRHMERQHPDYAKEEDIHAE